MLTLYAGDISVVLSEKCSLPLQNKTVIADKNIYEWSRCNQLRLNAEKISTMIFAISRGRKRLQSRFEALVNNVQDFADVDDFKLLGITVNWPFELD